MSVPRRRLVRPVLAPEPDQQRHHLVQKLRVRLEQERRVLARWMSKLKRAFHQVEKLSARISRIERNITRLEDS
jgi:hypothetical protein